MRTQFPFKMLLWVTLFAIAMGFLETSVVVYLRALLYPNGFTFPLAIMPLSLAITELLREAATLIMLVGIGYMAGNTFSTRFAWFIYAFAIWDIFYYVFLKALLNWPESWLTWDILFLIPVTWVGPVIAPVIVSLSMILLAILIIHRSSKKQNSIVNKNEWVALIAGSLILIVSFTWDYTKYILQHHTFTEIWTLPGSEMIGLIHNYIPQKFNWFLFVIGQSIIFAGTWMYFKRKK